MSTIQMIVDLCNCHYIPADQCEIVHGLVQKGIDPDLITHEVLYPEEVNAIDTRLYAGRTQGIG